MTPQLFRAALGHALKTLNWDDIGRNIDGDRVNHLRFADDSVLVLDNFEGPKDMPKELRAACIKVGLEVNFGKSKMMTNLIHNERIKNVSIGQ